MLIKYRFNVVGKLRTENTFPLKIGSYFIDFVTEKGVITAIEVFEPTDLSNLPRVESNDGKIHSIHINDGTIDKIKNHLKLTEGLLSVFGLRAIDTENFTVKWIPADDKEKELLQVYEFSQSHLSPDDHDEKVSFDLIARPFIAGFYSTNYEISLSFYRKGKNDMSTRDYIEAFYDFYFVLESLYGDGKTKNNQIEQKFIESQQIKVAIQKTKLKVELIQHLSQKIKNPFDYLNSSPDEIIKHFVLRRGFLHHQNPKHPDAWTPDKQKDFHLDAAFLMNVAHDLIFNKVMEYIEEDKIVKTYVESYRSTTNT